MPARNFTDSEEAEIAKIYLSGKSTRAIAASYGLSHHISICDALKRQGITQRSKEERNRLYKCNPFIFDKLDNEMSAYLHGFIYADGNVSRDKTLSISIANSDKAHLEKIRLALQTEAPVKTLVNKGYGNFRAVLSYTERHLAKELMDKGIIVNRPYPELIFKYLPDDMFNHWLRGFFDGDGTAKRDKAVGFCGSYQLMFLLRERITFNCDTYPDISIRKHVTKPTFYLTYSGRNVALRVANFMYKDATIWLERKRNIINNWPVPDKANRNEKGQFIKTLPFNENGK